MRYALLVLLNLPVILLALLNILTQYKMGKMGKRRFRSQFILWVGVLLALLFALPIYNTVTGSPTFDAHDLSLLDIIQTAAIVYMFYIINNQRRKSEKHERTIRELHQELAITLSSKDR